MYKCRSKKMPRGGIKRPENRTIRQNEKTEDWHNTIFCELIMAKEHDSRKTLRDCLINEGDKAVPMLLSKLQDPDDLIRWEAINLLGVIAPQRAVRQLVEFALNENERHARWRAFWSITCLDPTQTIPMLLSALRSRNYNRRWRAAIVLSMMGRQEAGPTLRDGLKNSDPWKQWEALNAIKALGLRGVERQVAKFFEDGHALYLRQEATLALGSIGSPLAVRILKLALYDENFEVRWRAAMALGRMGKSALHVLRRKRHEERNDAVLRQIENEIRQLEINND
jgi:HEAT repeat protein